MSSPTNQIAGLFGKKAFEISYALIRIATQSGNSSFASYLDSYAMMLMDGVSRGEINATRQSLECIRQFLYLGSGSGFMRQNDADLIENEIAILNAAIAALEPSSLPDLHIEDIFTSKIADLSTHSDQKPRGSMETLESKAVLGRGIGRIAAEDRQEERQKKILEKIRQSGNCRIKDLQDYLPNVSERTLRYDLQELGAAGKVERRGNGGPSVSYRLKEKETEPISLPASPTPQLLPPAQV